MTTPRVPSAEETLKSMNCGGGDRQWQQDIETIRAYARAVLEAAAKTMCSHCDLGSKLDGQHHRWHVYGQEQFARCKALPIRALKDDL